MSEHAPFLARENAAWSELHAGLLLVARRVRPVDEEIYVHELTLMESLITTVMGEVGESRVHVVRIHVGRQACASAHALRFCFQICTRGTPLEGAALDIVDTPGDELRIEEVEVS